MRYLLSLLFLLWTTACFAGFKTDTLNVTGESALHGNVTTDNSFRGKGDGLTNLNASNFSTGTLPIDRGGVSSTNRTAWDDTAANNHTAYSANQAVNTTSNVSFNNITVKDVVNFNLTPTAGAASPGKLYWDTTYKTLSLNSDNDTNIQVGHETLVRGVSTEDILNGQAVYMSGASGVFPTFTLAKADNLGTSYVLGVATHDIPNGTEGIVTVRGVVNDINTSAFASGDQIYLSEITAGNYSTTIPASPNIAVRIGRVVKSNDTEGSVYLNPSVLTSQVSTTTAGAGARIFFLNDTEADIAGYGILQGTPTGTGEEWDNVTVNNNESLLDSYATAPAGLGSTLWEGGNWEFPIYANVSSTVGLAQIWIRVYRRAGASETELFNVTTGDLGSTAITLYDIKTTQPNFAANATDRLVVKYYANTTVSANRVVGFVHGGTTRYTSVSTPIQLRHNDLAGLQGGETGEYWHLNATEKGKVENITGAGEVSFYNGTALAGNNTIFRLISGSGVTQVWENTSAGMNVTIDAPADSPFDGNLSNNLIINKTNPGITFLNSSSNQTSRLVREGSTFKLYSNQSILQNASNGLTFNGSSNYAQITNPTGLPSGNTSFSIDYWFRCNDDSGSSYKMTYALGSSALQQSVYVYWTAPGGVIGTGFYGGAGDVDSNVSVANNTWYHIVQAYNTTHSILYVNNVKFSAEYSTANLGTAYLTLASLDGTDLYAPVTIDEFAIWNKALNDTEVAARYNSGSGLELSGTEEGLISVYHLNSISGTVAIDSNTTLNNNLTTYNTPVWEEGHVVPLEKIYSETKFIDMKDGGYGSLGVLELGATGGETYIFGNISINGTVKFIGNGTQMTGRPVCWKTATTIGQCTDEVNTTTFNCTCQ